MLDGVRREAGHDVGRNVGLISVRPRIRSDARRGVPQQLEEVGVVLLAGGNLIRGSM